MASGKLFSFEVHDTDIADANIGNLEEEFESCPELKERHRMLNYVVFLCG